MRADVKHVYVPTAIVAQTWLQLDKHHRAQGVDIDLAALKVARRRLMASRRANRKAVILQSAEYSGTGQSRFLLEDEEEEGLESGARSLDSALTKLNGSGQQTPTSASSSSTWAEGAASDRFERRYQARLTKARLKALRDEKEKQQEEEEGAHTEEVLLLQHADVLTLPIPDVQVEAPDLIYAGNYALSYFHDRRSLLAYLAQCRRTLRKRTGVLIVDPFAGPTSWDAATAEEREDQDRLWTQFAQEPGFLRPGEKVAPKPLHGDPLQFWTDANDVDSEAQAEQIRKTDSAGWQTWPRGRLTMVRKGQVGGGYEYWREDSSLDYVTNRFRMSLSFRFRDGSWLRDYFSYDFRVWSLREVTEAMEEVGFERLSVHAIPRTTETDNSAADEWARNRARTNSTASVGDSDDGLKGMANLMQRTEVNESGKSTYKILQPDQKLFANRSFGSAYIDVRRTKRVTDHRSSIPLCLSSLHHRLHAV